MNQGRLVFAQLLDSLPRYEFNKCVARYHGNHRIRKFSCYDQFLTMAFAQLAHRESLRDIEVCLKAMKEKLFHVGFRGTIARSTIADANEKRDSKIFSDFAQVLIRTAKERNLLSISTTQFTLWIRRLSIFVWHCFPGQSSGGAKAASNFTRF